MLLIHPKDFFLEMVRDAVQARKVKTFPLVETYLSGVLEFFLDSKNMTQEPLAILYLKAQNEEQSNSKIEIYRRLADTSLYISGFFADSLARKLVDVDYYINMGQLAYSALADYSDNDLQSKVYDEIVKNFLEFTEVFTYISQNTMVHGDQNLLQLYERYLKTGSSLAQEKLLELGILAVPQAALKEN